jgi:hypothetical protein
MDRFAEVKRKALYLNHVADTRDLLAQSKDGALSFTTDDGTIYRVSDPDGYPGWSYRGNVYEVSGHDDAFDLRPTISEAELSELEAQHGITLPDDYRRFLLEIGNGGPGPYTRMDSIDSVLSYARHSEGDPTAPFPHSSPWLPRYLFGDEASDDGTWYAEHHTNGTLLISSYGCTLNVVLILNGPERGNVWIEDLGADNGLWHITSATIENVMAIDLDNEQPHLSFLDWYEQALDEQIRQKEPIRRRLEQALEEEHER